MGFRIQNNISSNERTAGIWLFPTQGMSKSLERLSSGYRINSAKDDAAGLAISQGYRSNNASDKSCPEGSGGSQRTLADGGRRHDQHRRHPHPYEGTGHTGRIRPMAAQT